MGHYDIVRDVIAADTIYEELPEVSTHVLDEKKALCHLFGAIMAIRSNVCPDDEPLYLDMMESDTDLRYVYMVPSSGRLPPLPPWYGPTKPC